MKDTHHYVCMHFIFSTKNRTNSIPIACKDRVCDYISGIINSIGGKSLQINCMPDHAHILCELPRSISISDFMRIVKSKSSTFIKELSFNNGFHWQDGYGVFSVSKSVESIVADYIKEQETHHGKSNFESEYASFLQRHGIEL